MKRWNLIPRIPSLPTPSKSFTTSLLPPPPPPPPITPLLRRGLHPQALQASDAQHPLQTIPLFIKSGFSSDLRLGTLLVSRFSSYGDLAGARGLLLNMPATDTAAWNALIAGCARHGLTEPAFRSMEELQLHGLRPDAFTLSSLLKAASDIQESEIIHGIAVKVGFFSADFVVCGLLHSYSKAGDLGSAEKCFCESPASDPVVWTAMVSGYVKNRELDTALQFFMEMRCLGLRLNEFCLASVLAALADEGWKIKQGVQIHGLSVKMGFLPFGSTPLSNALLSLYCSCGTKSDGLRAFEEIREPDVVSWSTLLGVFDGAEALDVFRFLSSTEMEINEYTLINVLSAIDEPGLLKCGIQIHSWCLKSGFLSVVPVGNALISMYGKGCGIDDAERVFDEMGERDIVSWNAMIAVYAATRSPDSALGLFSQMRHSLLQPNTVTLLSLSEAISCSSSLNQLTQIHSYITKSGHVSDDCMATTLITAYGKCGRIEESKQVFDEADIRDLALVNALATTYVEAGYHADALKLFKTSRSLGVDVDSATVSVVVKACRALTSIEQGRSMHSLALKLGINHDSFVGSAVIDLYCKCGALDDATKVFEKIPKGNLAAWNAMITGYAQHGDHDKVVESFERMLELGVGPDEITFLGVLYSCCHAGNVEGAYHYLNSMIEIYLLAPSLEHYACVIDLLGRVGCLEEARSSIDRMPVNPDARVWQSFLTACSIHRNVEFGEVASRKLLELEPDNESAYVLLSNIYAAAGMWDEVRRVRRGMKEGIICKEPGCSWIQVRGGFHSFFASDTSHPRTLDIRLMLEDLKKQTMVVQLIEDWR